MEVSANVVLNQRDIARAMERRSARAIAQRAERLGVQMEKVIKGMIDSELGPSSGRDAARGMVPMRELNWEHEVENPGTLPISVELTSEDIKGGPTGKKFGALNNGWAHYPGKQWLKRTAAVARGRAGARFI